jgi:hypothetical protein
MNDQRFDLSAYERDVIEHLLFGMARTRMFEDALASKTWNVDLPKAALEIGGRVYETQILGTFAPGSQTFLWAWANPGSAKWGPALFAAKHTQARGEYPGYAVFAQREIAASWVHPREVAHVVGELTGGHPVYAPTSNGTSVYLLVATPIDPTKISPAYLPGILLDFQSIALGNREACVARFFERLGFQVSRSATETACVRSDGTSMRVFWEEQQRISKVMLDAPAAH